MSRTGPRVRPERVAEQIRVEMGDLLQNEIKDPRVKLTTVTRVTVTPDLKLARIYVSVLADASGQKRALEALEHATGYVRRSLGERLGLRSAPELRFVYDPSVEYGIRLEKLLDEVLPPALDSPESKNDQEPSD